jgi:hypothetical protein
MGGPCYWRRLHSTDVFDNPDHARLLDINTA